MRLIHSSQEMRALMRNTVLLATLAAIPICSASFFVPTCLTTVEEWRAQKAAGCHPKIFSNSRALNVQYRWRPTQSVRPIASVALGTLRTAYNYSTLDSTKYPDSSQTSTFATVRGGGEFSIARLVHIAVLAGYRKSFRNTSLNTTSSNSGFTIGTLLMIGRRYREP